MKSVVFHTAAALFALSMGTAAVSCKQDPGASSSSAQNPLYSRGKAIYQGNCIACHHSNPRMAGPIGPDVWGSSKELLEARILRAEYPAGYKPKRETHVMQALPQLKGEIDALHVYLNNP